MSTPLGAKVKLLMVSGKKRKKRKPREINTKLGHLSSHRTISKRERWLSFSFGELEIPQVGKLSHAALGVCDQTTIAKTGQDS